MPVHLLAGQDDVSIDEAVQALVSSARLPLGMEEVNTARFDSSSYAFEAFCFACEAIPFLAVGRVVICRGVLASLTQSNRRAATVLGNRDDAGDLVAEQTRATAVQSATVTTEPRTRTSPKSRKAANVGIPTRTQDQALADYLPSVPTTTLVIFTELDVPTSTTALGMVFAATGPTPGVAPSPNGRRTLVTAPCTVRLFPVPQGDALERWLKARATKLAGPGAPPGGILSNGAAELLAKYVGADLRLASIEIAKLVTYVGPGRTIEKADVELLSPETVAMAKVWELTQAVLDGRRDLSAKRLAQLLDGALLQPEQVLASLRSAISQHLTVLARSQSGDDDATIARALRIQPYAAKMTRERAQRLGDRVLTYMHRQTVETDFSLKTGRQKSRLAAEILVIELTGRAVQAMSQQRRSSIKP